MCAAPNSAYLTEKLPLQNVGVAKYDNLLALKLSEYGSNIKSLFYLDALLVAKENDGTKEGFCGMVIVGGANAAMHASARYGKGRTSPDSGATKYIILNDGGLNTLAFTSFFNWITTSPNNLFANLLFKSSYYDDTSDYGFEFKKETESTWVSVSIASFLARNTEISGSTQLISPVILPLTFYNFRFYITNPEGTKKTDSILVQTNDMVYSENFYPQASACGTEGAAILIYFKQQDRLRMYDLTSSPSSVIPPIIGYEDASFSTPISEGWYKSSMEDYTYFYSNTEGFNQRTYCAPPVTYKVKLTISVQQPAQFENRNYSVFAEVLGASPLGASVTITGNLVGIDGGVTAYSIPISITLGASQMSNSYSDTYFSETDVPLIWDVTGLASSNTSVLLDTEIQKEINII